MTGDIIKKLKNLREIKPSAEWKKSSRDFLLTKIKEEKYSKELFPIQKKSWVLGASELFFSKEFFSLTLKPAVSFASIVALVLGSGFSVSASQMALPGDTLYSLKIASERVQVALAFKEESRAKIHVELAGKRLNEVKRIKENTDPDKNQKINIAIDKFQEEIRTVKTQLDNLGEKEEGLEVAKIVDSKTHEYREALVGTVSGGETEVSEEVAQKISDGLALADETGDQALTVIAEKQNDSDSKNDLAKRIEKKVQTIEEKALQVEESLASLNTDNREDVKTLSKEAIKNLDGARVVLSEAREMLKKEGADINEALNKVMESKGLIRVAEEIALETRASGEETMAVEPAEVEPIAEETETPPDIPSQVVAPVAVRKISQPVVKEEPKEVDESELRVGIDLKQVL
ncbi:MAG TPA: DUF5667 domain-containing protein [Patescibacteria group bacterium]|nr:DUF5667 domain-containing protein [Patescibacteria group bacterium]